jgi:glutathione S-transferase
MALIIYGSPRSRTMRTLWMAEELGLSYEHRPLAWDDPWLKSDEFLDLNPAGSVPTIDDDGFALSESMAINLYLAKRYGGALYPRTPTAEAETWRWSLWAQAHLEAWLQMDEPVLRLRGGDPEGWRSLVHMSLTTLERALAARVWLTGDAFTVADLNVAGVLSPSRVDAVDLTAFNHVSDWLARCYARPAACAVRSRFA